MLALETGMRRGEIMNIKLKHIDTKKQQLSIPTIQMLEHLGLYKFNPYVGFLASVVITITLAAFSWHAVEKRFLKRSSHYITATKIA
jgi:integrase